MDRRSRGPRQSWLTEARLAEFDRKSRETEATLRAIQGTIQTVQAVCRPVVSNTTVLRRKLHNADKAVHALFETTHWLMASEDLAQCTRRLHLRVDAQKQRSDGLAGKGGRVDWDEVTVAVETALTAREKLSAGHFPPNFRELQAAELDGKIRAAGDVCLKILQWSLKSLSLSTSEASHEERVEAATPLECGKICSILRRLDRSDETLAAFEGARVPVLHSRIPSAQQPTQSAQGKAQGQEQEQTFDLRPLDLAPALRQELNLLAKVFEGMPEEAEEFRQRCLILVCVRGILKPAKRFVVRLSRHLDDGATGRGSIEKAISGLLLCACKGLALLDKQSIVDALWQIKSASIIGESVDLMRVQLLTSIRSILQGLTSHEVLRAALGESGASRAIEETGHAKSWDTRAGGRVLPAMTQIVRFLEKLMQEAPIFTTIDENFGGAKKFRNSLVASITTAFGGPATSDGAAEHRSGRSDAVAGVPKMSKEEVRSQLDRTLRRCNNLRYLRVHLQSLDTQAFDAFEIVDPGLAGACGDLVGLLTRPLQAAVASPLPGEPDSADELANMKTTSTFCRALKQRFAAVNDFIDDMKEFHMPCYDSQLRNSIVHEVQHIILTQYAPWYHKYSTVRFSKKHLAEYIRTSPPVAKTVLVSVLHE